jgi:hypothetical protein
MLASAQRSSAQAHPEWIDISDQHGWHFTADVFADYYSGNVNQSDFSVNLTTSYHKARHESMLEGFFVLGYFDGEQWVEQSNLWARHVQQLGKSSFSFDVYGQYQKNTLIGLVDRKAFGSGMRREFFTKGGEEDPFDLFVATGLMYEKERFEVLVREDASVMRFANYVTATWEPNDAWLINVGAYLNLNPSKLSDYRQQLALEMLFQLGDGLFLSTKSRTQFDSQPGVGIKKFDMFHIIGFGYSF